SHDHAAATRRSHRHRSFRTSRNSTRSAALPCTTRRPRRERYADSISRTKSMSRSISSMHTGCARVKWTGMPRETGNVAVRAGVRYGGVTADLRNARRRPAAPCSPGGETMLQALTLMLLLAVPAIAVAAELPIFDAHIHY